MPSALHRTTVFLMRPHRSPPRVEQGRTLIAALLVLALAPGCARVTSLPPGQTPDPGWTERGVASWYGEDFHGRRTASGEVYDMEAMTAAHQALPFGTLVEVENLANQRSVTLTINDRGPFVRGRNLDVSRAAARELGMKETGLAEIRLTVLEAPHSP